MAAKTYEVTWQNVSNGGVPERRVVAASSMGAALNAARHHMDLNRGGSMHEVATVRIERIS